MGRRSVAGRRFALVVLAGVAPTLFPASLPARAFDPRQWSDVKREPGAAMLVCTVAACGGLTATVSYRAMKPEIVPDQATFLNAAKGIADQRKANGAATQQLLARDDSKAGQRHYFVLDQVTYSDGRKEFFAAGFLATPAGAWMLGTSGPTMQVVAGNYDELTATITKRP